VCVLILLVLFAEQVYFYLKSVCRNLTSVVDKLIGYVMWYNVDTLINVLHLKQKLNSLYGIT